MKATQVAKVQREAKTRISDIISSGEHFRSLSSDISAKAYAAIPANLPGYAREYLRGYIDARFDLLWRTMEFRYQLADGSWINAHDLEYDNDCPRDNVATCSHSGHYVATHNPPAAHFWAGTDRFYTTPRPISDK